MHARMTSQAIVASVLATPLASLRALGVEIE